MSGGERRGGPSQRESERAAGSVATRLTGQDEEVAGEHYFKCMGVWVVAADVFVC